MLLSCEAGTSVGIIVQLEIFVEKVYSLEYQIPCNTNFWQEKIILANLANQH